MSESRPPERCISWVTMSRYYLNIRTGHDLATDDEGCERSSLEAATDEAIRGVRSILAEEVSHGRLDLRSQIEVTDEAGAVVATVLFADVIDIVR